MKEREGTFVRIFGSGGIIRNEREREGERERGNFCTYFWVVGGYALGWEYTKVGVRRANQHGSCEHYSSAIYAVGLT